MNKPRPEKSCFCICKSKGADRLRGNRAADQRLCSRYIDSTIPLLPKSELSFEISRNILRNHKIFIGLDSNILNSFSYLSTIWIYFSHCMTSLVKCEITVFFLLSLPVHSGSLKRIDYPKQLSGPPSFF